MFIKPKHVLGTHHGNMTLGPELDRSQNVTDKAQGVWVIECVGDKDIDNRGSRGDGVWKV